MIDWWYSFYFRLVGLGCQERFEAKEICIGIGGIIFLRHGSRSSSVQSAVWMLWFMVTYCKDFGILDRKRWKDVDSTGECYAVNRAEGLSPISEGLGKQVYVPLFGHRFGSSKHHRRVLPQQHGESSCPCQYLPQQLKWRVPMRRAMEYVWWELDNWRTQRHGRDMAIFTETKKVASYMWQSWKRGALVVLVLAFSPILFPLVLFLSFFGFISAVPLLCGAAAYYLIFRSFSLPLSISELFNPSNRPSEDRMLESVPFVVQEIEKDESLSKTSTIDKEGADDPGIVSDSKAILLLECELIVNERDEADIREHQSTFKLNVPSDGNQRKSEFGAGSSSSVTCHSNAELQVRGPIFLLPSAKLKSQYEQRKEPGAEQQMYSDTNEATVGQPAAHVISPLRETTKSSTRVSTMDVPVSGLLQEGCSLESVCGTACTPERLHITEVNRICHAGTCYGSSMVEGYGEYRTTESVFIQHNVTVAPAAESSETSGHFRGQVPDGKECPEGNRSLTENSEVKTKELENSTFIPFSHSALLTTPEGSARADSESISHTIPARYWRDEVEDTVLSSAIANITHMEDRSSGSSGDMASLLPWNSEFEKMTMCDQDVASLLECAEEAEAFSASQALNSGQYKEKMDEGVNRRTGSSLRFATALFTHQRRLSFSNVHADDEMTSPGFFLSREKFNDCTPDCKKRSVSTSFSSDYTWPSESSEQGFEFLSTRGTAYEDSFVDTDSSTAQVDEESDLEPGVLSDSTLFPTPDQLTEDWETRRKRWEEESTLGRLAPLSPYIEARSVEARSICNPLFEFSTPSPPLKKLKTGDKNHTSNLPSIHIRFTKRQSATPETLWTQTWSSGSTLSPRRLSVQECKSGLYAERPESNTRSHARSYSASFTESLEPCSGEFEGLLGYW